MSLKDPSTIIIVPGSFTCRQQNWSPAASPAGNKCCPQQLHLQAASDDLHPPLHQDSQLLPLLTDPDMLSAISNSPHSSSAGCS